MNKLKISVASICMFLGASFASATPSSNIDDYKILTELFPPFNLTVNGKLQGISVDILSDILKDIGSKKTTQSIEVKPWIESYSEIQTKENVMLFSTTRIPEREKLFKWVGPIASTPNIMVAKKDSKIKITDLKDINDYVTAVEEDSADDLMLREYAKDQKKILRVEKIEDLVLQLNSGKANLIVIGKNTLASELKRMNLSPDEYKAVYFFKDWEVYYAFSKTTPDSLINSMQASLDKIKNTATYNKIIEKYIN